MPTRTLNRGVGDVAKDPTNVLRQLVDGIQMDANGNPNEPSINSGASIGMPTADGRWVASAFTGQMRYAQFEFLPHVTPGSSTPDDNGNDILPTDDVDLVCDFEPKIAVIHNNAGTPNIQFLFDLFPSTEKGFTVTTGAPGAVATLAGTDYTFGADKFTIKAAALSTNEAVKVILLG